MCLGVSGCVCVCACVCVCVLCACCVWGQLEVLGVPGCGNLNMRTFPVFMIQNATLLQHVCLSQDYL